MNVPLLVRCWIHHTYFDVRFVEGHLSHNRWLCNEIRLLQMLHWYNIESVNPLLFLRVSDIS